MELPTPAQLPADIPDFVGRCEPVAQLVEMLKRPGGPNLCALHGLDGMGKTTLAVHVAHRLRSHYPDGQLYADLHGAGSRVEAPAVLARFLRALGFAGELPRDLDERAALWRSYVNGRRLLLVLDDAFDSDQVRHLLPGSPESGAIITSVHRMSDLPALQSLEVGPLTTEESADLLGTMIGMTRAGVEPEAFSGLLDISAGLPLALRTIGRRVAERRTWRIADVVRRLPHDSSEIHDDAYRSIQEAVGHLEELLNPEVANALRVLRVVGVAEFDLESVAAVLDVSRTRALAIMDSLTEVHLLERRPESRFEMLNPVRVFAGELPRTRLRPRGRSAIA